MNRRTTDLPLAELMPHARPMILIDAVVDYDDDSLRALVNIREDNLFLEQDQRIPAWVGIEYMAQAVSAWSGALACESKQPVQIGFLLASRSYRAHTDAFNIGDTLQVSILKAYIDDTMGVFECTIHRDDRLLAEADLKTYQPTDPESFMEQTT